MSWTKESIVQGILSRDRRAIARLITLIENNNPEVADIQTALFKHTGKAKIIGITGAPGAGKSTLVDHVAVEYRKKGKKVAILAIDPTSPFSGGAILGDRIRMNKVAEDPDIYLRSMATRGALGGLARTTFQAISVLDAAGFDYVLVETVGVGQVEVDIVRTVDTCVVVLVPGMGDAVQTFKAGILEIADLFVINKSDREGADLVHKDLRLLISLGDYKDNKWTPTITKTVATTGGGTDELVDTVKKHQDWLDSSKEGIERKKNVTKSTVLKLVCDSVLEEISNSSAKELERYVQECVEKKVDLYSIVRKLRESLK